MKNKPLVSIVTGYYNRKENLKPSIESILNQDYDNFEYLVFDDCSNDGTYEMLAEFKDSRLKLIRHSENIGFTKGIIQAISKCKGEYIAIHGAGDISYPNRIRKQVNMFLSNPKLGIVGCLLEDVHKGITTIHSPVKHEERHNFTQGEVMYLKSLYYKVGGYNSFFKYGQFTHLKREFLKFAEADYVNEILYKRIHFENGVTKNPLKVIEQGIYIQIGKKVSSDSILKVDLSEILVKYVLKKIELLKKGSNQEEIFIFHLKRRYKFIYILYILYKRNIINVSLFKKLCKKILN